MGPVSGTFRHPSCVERRLTDTPGLDNKTGQPAAELVDTGPSLSSDGTTYAFSSKRGGDADIYLMNASDGRTPTRGGRQQPAPTSSYSITTR